MTLQTGNSSSEHRIATGEMTGNSLQHDTAGLLRAVPKAATPEERKSAAEKMRHRLYRMDRSQHRMSIEDCAAAILERSGAGHSA